MNETQIAELRGRAERAEAELKAIHAVTQAVGECTGLDGTETLTLKNVKLMAIQLNRLAQQKTEITPAREESALTVRLNDAWSRSLVEELIAALWVIAAILCFGFGFNVAGWCFAAKAILDTGTAIFFAVIEAIREHKGKSSNA